VNATVTFILFAYVIVFISVANTIPPNTYSITSNKRL